jgi:hypothetical protein
MRNCVFSHGAAALGQSYASHIAEKGARKLFAEKSV